MSLGTDKRDQLRALANRVRAIPGERFGLRPYSVAVVTSEWSGAEVGQGTATVTSVAVTEANGQPPKVRNLTSEELALAGYDTSTWEIGPITPDYSGGGTAFATLEQSAVEANTEAWIVLTGPEFPDGGKFRRVNATYDRALHYTIQVQRVAD